MGNISGLTINPSTLVRKTRRLPVKGKILVKQGDYVEGNDIIARADMPGFLEVLKVAEKLGIEPIELRDVLIAGEGENVKQGQVLAALKYFFGLFKSEYKSPADGNVEYVSNVTGHVGLRRKPKFVELKSHISGKIAEILSGEGAVVETRASLVQGIFGLGGERQGKIKVFNTDFIMPEAITEEFSGAVLVIRGNIDSTGLKKAVRIKVAGVVCGGIFGKDLNEFLGYEIGSAVTGLEDIGLTVIITEGFGEMKMSERTFKLFSSLNGKSASIDGTTQVRAGVIRPEIIVPIREPGKVSAQENESETKLEIGSNIRLIRSPYFGRTGIVTEMPAAPSIISTGSRLRVLVARLDSGEIVTVPRANAEIIT